MIDERGREMTYAIGELRDAAARVSDDAVRIVDALDGCVGWRFDDIGTIRDGRSIKGARTGFEVAVEALLANSGVLGATNLSGEALTLRDGLLGDWDVERALKLDGMTAPNADVFDAAEDGDADAAAQIERWDGACADLARAVRDAADRALLALRDIRDEAGDDA